MSKIRAIVCPQCGSSDVTRIDEDDVVCNSCGCQFRIEQEKIINNNVVNNEIHYHINGEEYENLDKVNTKTIKLDKSIDEYALKRKTLIALCKKGVRYDEINKFSFEEPVISYYSSMVIQMRYEFSYTATIGTYRDEIYYEPVRVYSAAFRGYVTRNEKRIKTVTDWVPFTGRDVQEGMGSACLNTGLNKNDVSPKNADCLINAFVSKNYVGGGTQLTNEVRFPLINSITSNDEKIILDACQKNAIERVCKNMPGDTHKQEKCIVENSSYAGKTVYYYPICKQEYSYNGTTFICYSLFTDGGDSMIVIPKSAPIDSKLSLSKEEVNKENKREGKYVLMLVFAIILMVAGVIGFISICIISSPLFTLTSNGDFYSNVTATMIALPLLFLFIAGSISLFTFRSVGIRKETNLEFNQRLSIVKKKKIEMCNRILKENNMYLLTQEECTKF